MFEIKCSEITQINLQREVFFHYEKKKLKECKEELRTIK